MTYDEILSLRDLIARSLRHDSPAVVATLIAREGHSYRAPGAMMVINEALEIAGGVSGGCLEEYIGRAGRELLRDRDSVLMNFDTATEAPDRPSLGCGGRLQILVEHARADHLAYLDVILDCMGRSDRTALFFRVNDEGAWPDVASCRSVVCDGRVVFGAALPDSAAAQWVDEAVQMRESLAMPCRSGLYAASYLWPQPRLVLFGGRDDAKPLVQIAKAASWHVTVVDRRLRLVTQSRFGQADQIVGERWDRAIASIAFTPWTAAVVMTHSVEDDIEILSQLLSLPIDYVGLLGPSVRTDRLWESLPPEGRSRVCSPVGLALGDKSPSAVAVAIVAELIAWRRGRVHVMSPAAESRV